jgi:hypothetical protein
MQELTVKNFLIGTTKNTGIPGLDCSRQKPFIKGGEGNAGAEGKYFALGIHGASRTICE